MKFPIRTLTLGISDRHPLPPKCINRAHHILERVRRQYESNGYTVQTTRLSTQSLFRDLADWGRADVLDYARELQVQLDTVGIDFCSLGAAQPEDLHQDVNLIADLLSGQRSLAASIKVAQHADGISSHAINLAANTIRHLAEQTDESFGNFQFAAIANVGPGGAFFPSAYHTGPATLSIGTQSANVISSVAEPRLSLKEITHRICNAVTEYAMPVVEIGSKASVAAGIKFGGIDVSPAPGGDDSVVGAIESFGFGRFGAPGTLALTAAITAALRCAELPKCGFNGLMLPVMEDNMLGRRWMEGSIGVDSLLCYSAVCGTGLDTIPLSGDVSQSSLENLIMDVAILALRLDKPLSARLMPICGKKHGDATTFTSPFMINTVVLDLLH